LGDPGIKVAHKARLDAYAQQVAERVGRPQRFISRVERGLHEFGTALDFDPAAALRRKAAKR
jgi:hypothetical protein